MNRARIKRPRDKRTLSMLKERLQIISTIRQMNKQLDQSTTALARVLFVLCLHKTAVRKRIRITNGLGREHAANVQQQDQKHS